MKVDEKGHTIIIKDTEGEVNTFLEKVSSQHNNFKDFNLVLDVTQDKSVDLKAIKLFTPLSKIHKKGKKSFVIVAENIDFNDVPASLLVVPTLLEAHDMIEMEEIERDLGF
ncbi:MULTISPECIES: ribonuclease Z [Flavobacterium]|uniref:ribonuclease Z n=1 Tax=Flavobacterium TaxID=237 RepID=UPI00095D8700|nr:MULTISPECIES: ribonuclease Z [Flavobacterium]MBN9284566.1 ribonuclease Z [Flavobacterium sp.]OJV68178.1 MAG: ribonuclease Z [Flavobacterium sp. 40-81]